MQLNMGIIKVEINVPEAVRALEEFRTNRKKALESIATSVKEAVSTSLNQLLHAEMTLFLGRPDQTDNKRNGYYERTYALKGIGAVSVKMPLDRKSRFESAVVPPNEQIDPRLKEDMAVLHLAGISTRMLSMMSNRILGTDVSSATISASLSSIEEQARAWLTRSLEGKYWALYIDGTNFRIQRRGSVAKEPSLVVLGIDETNRLSLLAIEPGTKDNVDAWEAVFNELIRRGLKSEHVRVGLMDGLPGLENLFRQTFPKSVTARCWVHALKNALNKTPERLREAFKKAAHRVMYAASENAAREAFDELKKLMATDADRAVRCLEKDLESLLVHYRFEKKLWRALKTTNPIERVNREFKRRTKSMDSLGEKTLETLLGFTAMRLEYNWQLRPVDSPHLDNLVGVKKNSLHAAMTRLELVQ
jgi:putative transposase